MLETSLPQFNSTGNRVPLPIRSRWQCLFYYCKKAVDFFFIQRVIYSWFWTIKNKIKTGFKYNFILDLEKIFVSKSWLILSPVTSKSYNYINFSTCRSTIWLCSWWCWQEFGFYNHGTYFEDEGLVGGQGMLLTKWSQDNLCKRLVKLMKRALN